jgi:hypothetical protein
MYHAPTIHGCAIIIETGLITIDIHEDKAVDAVFACTMTMHLTRYTSWPSSVLYLIYMAPHVMITAVISPLGYAPKINYPTRLGFLYFNELILVSQPRMITVVYYIRDWFI